MNARFLSAAALTAAVILTAVAGTINHRASQRTRAFALVAELLKSPAAGVPYALEDLRLYRDLVGQRLRGHVDDPRLRRVERMHAAYLLAESDQAVVRFLIEQVAESPASECRNLITALAHHPATAAALAASKSSTATDPATQARYAIVALHLGDPHPAARLLALSGDPLRRTTFIHAYRDWHGNTTEATTLLTASQDDAFRSGVAVALGTLEPEEIGNAAKALSQLYREALDGGTHAAAGWALRQSGEQLPDLPPSSRPTGNRRWFVNGQGMTMIELAPGTFVMGTPGAAHFDDESPVHEVALTRALNMSDREVTVEQFLRFVRDSDYPAAEKPPQWEEEARAANSALDGPVQMASWFDAVLYCNWLSAREGRRACYQRIGKQKLKDFAGREEEHDLWRCEWSADGYRLPTEAEWEYAARAGSAGSYSFGEETTRLQNYAWFANNSGARAWPGGLKLPNAWGLFDLHGNVLEWCWDREGNYPSEAVRDPVGPDDEPMRILRGGAADVGALGCRSAFRYNQRPTHRSPGYGFRVCCGP